MYLYFYLFFCQQCSRTMPALQPAHALPSTRLATRPLYRRFRVSGTQGKAEPSLRTSQYTCSALTFNKVKLVLLCSLGAASLLVKISRSLFLYLGKTDFCFSLQKGRINSYV